MDSILASLAVSDLRFPCGHCGYAAGLILSERDGRPLWWCVSCQDGRAIGAILKNAGALPDRVQERRAPAAVSHTSASQSSRALALYDAAAPWRGTPADAYFAARLVRPSPAAPIRFLSDCPHPSGARLPAVVARVTTAAGEPVAIHRTFLRPDGHARAAADPAKATLGPIHGNAAVLDQPGRKIVVGEGIESSLAASAIFGLPAIAALTAGSLATARWLPPGVSRVLIAADRDASGAGQRAAAAAARELRRRGVAVRVALPDDEGSDFNDILRARHAALEAAHAG